LKKKWRVGEMFFVSRLILAGFYSYGEIAPFIAGAKCELQNQTMTIKTLLEE